MKVQTFSIVGGNEACNAACPFCVSRMTPANGVDLEEPWVNWRNFDVACRFAKDNNVSTVLLTGKGEPTLFPGQITDYLKQLRPYRFPFIELQTNGILLAQNPEYEKHMSQWYELGVTMVALSIAHHDSGKNHEVTRPNNGRTVDLPDLIERLRSHGFSVRLSCTLLKGYIDSVAAVNQLADFARENSVEQLTLRPVEKPEKSRDKEVYDWVSRHKLDRRQEQAIRNYLRKKGTEVLRLVHGAAVYDLDGQNVCLSNALTIDAKSGEVRQLIFFPDGHLRYDWQYMGAMLI